MREEGDAAAAQQLPAPAAQQPGLLAPAQQWRPARILATCTGAQSAQKEVRFNPAQAAQETSGLKLLVFTQPHPELLPAQHRAFNWLRVLDSCLQLPGVDPGVKAAQRCSDCTKNAQERARLTTTTFQQLQKLQKRAKQLL